MDKPNTPKIPNVPVVQFFKEVVSELKKVTWPTRDETIKLTVVVIAISVVTALFIGGLDAFFIKITTLVFQK
jgi:preprotein translocase subunit SecE